MCSKVTWETILRLREWNVSFMVTGSIQLPAASPVESMNAPVCLEHEAFVSGRSSQIWSVCLAKPLWTGKCGFFSVHFSYRLSENGWGICFYDDKPDGAMGPRRLQLPLSGEWGRAMLLFLLQQPWNGACRFHQLQKMIASTFIALGGELSLGKRKGKKRIDIFLPGNMADAFRNEAIAKHLCSHLCPCLLLFWRISQHGAFLMFVQVLGKGVLGASQLLPASSTLRIWEHFFL